MIRNESNGRLLPYGVLKRGRIEHTRNTLNTRGKCSKRSDTFTDECRAHNVLRETLHNPLPRILVLGVKTLTWWRITSWIASFPLLWWSSALLGRAIEPSTELGTRKRDRTFDRDSPDSRDRGADLRTCETNTCANKTNIAVRFPLAVRRAIIHDTKSSGDVGK